MALSYACLRCNELMLLISNEIFDGNCWEKTQNTKQSVVVLARHFQYQVEIFFQIYCSKWAFK